VTLSLQVYKQISQKSNWYSPEKQIIRKHF